MHVNINPRKQTNLEDDVEVEHERKAARGADGRKAVQE